MADFVILLMIVAAVAGILWYKRKNKRDISKEKEAVRNSAGGISCGKSCAGCSGCDLGRMGGTPIVEQKPDHQDRKIHL